MLLHLVILRRAVAFLVLGLLFVGLWMLTIQPMINCWENSVSDYARAKRLLLTYQGVIQNRTQWESRLKQLQERSLDRVFIEAGDSNIAAAKFQTNVKQTVEQSGGVIGSIQVLPIVSDRGLQRLGVRVSFVATPAVLFHLLEKVEHGEPYIFLDGFNLTAPERDVKGNKDQPNLSIRSSFYSYLQPREP